MNIKTIALSIAIVAISGLITYTALSLFVSRSTSDSAGNTTKTPTATSPTTTAEPEVSPKGLTITLKIISNQPAYTYGDTLALLSSIQNTTSTPLSFQFSNTCTAPDVFFNGQKASLSGLCGAAFTDVTIAPGETITYDDKYTFKVPESDPILPVYWDTRDGLTSAMPGTYDVTTKWQDATSNAVSVVIEE